MSAKFDVRYTAKLARLHLSEEEIAKFQAQLSQVLEYVEKLENARSSGSRSAVSSRSRAATSWSSSPERWAHHEPPPPPPPPPPLNPPPLLNPLPPDAAGVDTSALLAVVSNELRLLPSAR